MLKYTVVALHEMLKAFPDDEEKVSNVLNAFECANNKENLIMKMQKDTVLQIAGLCLKF